MPETSRLYLHSPAGSDVAVYRWPLHVSESWNEPHEIVETIRWVCYDFPELKLAVENYVLNNFDPGSFESMKILCEKYNRAVDNIRKLWSGRQPPPCIDAPPTVQLLKHILTQVYNRAITKPEELNTYQAFSPEVYGETSFELVSAMISSTHMNENDVFLDLGSGVGQIVLQVAATVGCKSYGIEKAEIPAKYAEEMNRQFIKWMDFYGKSYGDFEVLRGDFLDPQFDEIFQSATVIFCNNFAFGPTLNHKLKLKFQNLRDGVKIVSSREFCPLNFRLTERNLSDIGAMMRVAELSPLKGSVSWTSKPVSYYLHKIDRTRMEEFFHKQKHPEEIKSECSVSSFSCSSSDSSSEDSSLDITDDGDMFRRASEEMHHFPTPSSSKMAAAVPPPLDPFMQSKKHPLLLTNETSSSIQRKATPPSGTTHLPRPHPQSVFNEGSYVTSLALGSGMKARKKSTSRGSNSVRGRRIRGVIDTTPLFERFQDQMESYIDHMNNPQFVSWVTDSIEKEKMKRKHLQGVIEHLESEVSTLSLDTISNMKDSMCSIGITNLTPEGLLLGAKDIVMLNRQLRREVQMLEKDVFKLKEENSFITGLCKHVDKQDEDNVGSTVTPPTSCSSSQTLAKAMPISRKETPPTIRRVLSPGNVPSDPVGAKGGANGGVAIHFPSRVEGSANVGVVPSSANVGVVPSSANVGVVPSSANVGVVPSSANVGVVPSSDNVGVVPSSANVGVVPNSANVGVVPSSANVGVVPNSSSSNLMGVVSNTVGIVHSTCVVQSNLADGAGIDIELPVGVSSGMYTAPSTVGVAIKSEMEMPGSLSNVGASGSMCRPSSTVGVVIDPPTSFPRDMKHTSCKCVVVGEAYTASTHFNDLDKYQISLETIDQAVLELGPFAKDVITERTDLPPLNWQLQHVVDVHPKKERKKPYSPPTSRVVRKGRVSRDCISPMSSVGSPLGVEPVPKHGQQRRTLKKKVPVDSDSSPLLVGVLTESVDTPPPPSESKVTSYQETSAVEAMLALSSTRHTEEHPDTGSVASPVVPPSITQDTPISVAPPRVHYPPPAFNKLVETRRHHGSSTSIRSVEDSRNSYSPLPQSLSVPPMRSPPLESKPPKSTENRKEINPFWPVSTKSETPSSSSYPYPLMTLPWNTVGGLHPTYLSSYPSLSRPDIATPSLELSVPPNSFRSPVIPPYYFYNHAYPFAAAAGGLTTPFANQLIPSSTPSVHSSPVSSPSANQSLPYNPFIAPPTLHPLNDPIKPTTHKDLMQSNSPWVMLGGAQLGGAQLGGAQLGGAQFQQGNFLNTNQFAGAGLGLPSGHLSLFPGLQPPTATGMTSLLGGGGGAGGSEQPDTKKRNSSHPMETSSTPVLYAPTSNGRPQFPGEGNDSGLSHGRAHAPPTHYTMVPNHEMSTGVGGAGKKDKTERRRKLKIHQINKEDFSSKASDRGGSDKRVKKVVTEWEVPPMYTSVVPPSLAASTIPIAPPTLSKVPNITTPSIVDFKATPPSVSIPDSHLPTLVTMSSVDDSDPFIKVDDDASSEGTVSVSSEPSFIQETHPIVDETRLLGSSAGDLGPGGNIVNDAKGSDSFDESIDVKESDDVMGSDDVEGCNDVTESNDNQGSAELEEVKRSDDDTMESGNMKVLECMKGSETEQQPPCASEISKNSEEASQTCTVSSIEEGAGEEAEERAPIDLEPGGSTVLLIPNQETTESDTDLPNEDNTDPVMCNEEDYVDIGGTSIEYDEFSPEELRDEEDSPSPIVAPNKEEDKESSLSHTTLAPPTEVSVCGEFTANQREREVNTPLTKDYGDRIKHSSPKPSRHTDYHSDRQAAIRKPHPINHRNDDRYLSHKYVSRSKNDDRSLSGNTSSRHKLSPTPTAPSGVRGRFVESSPNSQRKKMPSPEMRSYQTQKRHTHRDRHDDHTHYDKRNYSSVAEDVVEGGSYRHLSREDHPSWDPMGPTLARYTSTVNSLDSGRLSRKRHEDSLIAEGDMGTIKRHKIKRPKGSSHHHHTHHHHRHNNTHTH